MTIAVEILRREGASFLDFAPSSYALRKQAGARVEVLFVEGDSATAVGVCADGDGVRGLIMRHMLDRAHMARPKDGARPSVESLMQASGFEPYNSGGGCMVWRKGLDDGTYLYISNESAEGPLDGEVDAPIWVAGRYADEGCVDLTSGFPLGEALVIARTLPDPVGFDGQPSEIADATPFAIHAAAGTRDHAAKAVAARMGYEGAVRAASPAEGVEVCLVEAGRSHYAGWAVVTHEGCDPDDDLAGSSGVEEYPDRLAAEAGFRDTVSRYEAGPSAGPR